MKKSTELEEGDYVVCEGQDSYFEGTVVSVFKKLNGTVRYVVEDERRLLLIKGPNSITEVSKKYEVVHERNA